MANKRISEYEKITTGDIQDSDLFEIARPLDENYKVTWEMLKDENKALDHAERHRATGPDSLNVTGLTGVLAEQQKPQAHASSHGPSGADTLNVEGLTGLLADQQTPLSHDIGGSAHGADTLANLNNKISDATLDDVSGARTPSEHGNEKHNPDFSQIGIATGQIEDLTGKTTPANNDILVIEDSAASMAAKKLTMENLANFLGAIGNKITTYTSNDTWTKPDNLKFIIVELWGGGGSGAASTSQRASGAGGGAYNKKIIPVADLGATETVTVGAGGVARAAEGNGNVGGTTSFGTHLYAYGGGAGSLSGDPYPGGSGGGQLALGSPGYPISGVSATPNSTFGGAAGGDGTGGKGGSSYYGGAGGGGCLADTGGQQGAGGVSVHGGAGGAANRTGNGVAGGIRGGGGGAGKDNSGAGGRGEVRVIEFY